MFSFAKTVEVRIKEAMDVGIKIAVLPCNFNKNNISEVIVHDLNYSGQFRALNIDLEDKIAIAKAPKNTKDIDFRFWRELGAEYLLITKLYPSKDSSKLIMNLQLLDLYKPLEPISLNVELEKYPNEHPRKLAHRISNKIFKHLIGVTGFFNSKIAYVRVQNLGTKAPKYSLCIADFDGYNERILLTANYPIMSPAWSFDGKKIAFVAFKNNRSNISIADLELNKINVLTNYPGINGAPAWSPDGKHLALVLSKSGVPKIYLLNLFNHDLQQITYGSSIDTEPAWDKYGQELYFTSNRGGKPQIYKIMLATKEISRVTFSGDYNATPAITPDNNNLVMLHCQQNCSKNNLSYNIAVQSLVNGKVKILSKTGMEDSPVISPNGVMVLYSTENSRYGMNKFLAGVSLDGNFNSKLNIGGEGSIKSPAWSPLLNE